MKLSARLILVYVFVLMHGIISAAEPEQPVISTDTGTNTLSPSVESIKIYEKSFKNTIRFNTTNTLLFSSKTIVLGYERVVGSHQSFSIDIGPLSLPKLSIINTDNFASVSSTSTQKGIHVSGDYRFYLPNENRHEAPRGVYIGPYISYNSFQRKNTWTLNSSSFQGDVSTDFKLEMMSVGGELGYQFILWKRLAIDLVLIGPGLTNYAIKTGLSTTLSADDQAELLKLIHDALADKIPGYSLVIDDLEYEKSGSANTTTFGFRYMINIGFRF